MDDKLLIARYAVGKITPEDVIYFSNCKLKEGIYSDHFLDVLDVDKNHISDVFQPFEKALDDLGFEIPEYREAIDYLLNYHIKKISEGHASPTKQFSILLSDIDSFSLHEDITQYVGDNVGIQTMYGWYHEDSASIQETDNGIYEECIKWVAEYGKEH